MGEGNINATDDFEICEEEMVVFSLNNVFGVGMFWTKFNYLQCNFL